MGHWRLQQWRRRSRLGHQLLGSDRNIERRGGQREKGREHCYPLTMAPKHKIVRPAIPPPDPSFPIELPKNATIEILTQSRKLTVTKSKVPGTDAFYASLAYPDDKKESCIALCKRPSDAREAFKRSYQGNKDKSQGARGGNRRRNKGKGPDLETINWNGLGKFLTELGVNIKPISELANLAALLGKNSLK
nr:unnamed protein product [Digitaria exilis]